MSVTHHNLYRALALAVLSKEVLTTNTKTVEASTECQGFKGLAIDLTEVDALHEIEEVLVGTVLLAFINDGLRHTVAQALDGSQSETYLTLLVNTKLLV